MKPSNLIIELLREIFYVLKNYSDSSLSSSTIRIENQQALLQVLKNIEQSMLHSNELLLKKHASTEDRYLDSADIYERFKFGRTKLYMLKKTGVLKAYKLGGKDYFKESEVMDALRRED